MVVKRLVYLEDPITGKLKAYAILSHDKIIDLGEVSEGSIDLTKPRDSFISASQAAELRIQSLIGVQLDVRDHTMQFPFEG